MSVLSLQKVSLASRTIAGDAPFVLTVRFAVEVDDSSAVSDVLIRAGAQHVADPVEPPWGGVNVRVQAPDGMQLTLFTPPAT